jgi:hypothetical protein
VAGVALDLATLMRDARNAMAMTHDPTNVSVTDPVEPVGPPESGDPEPSEAPSPSVAESAAAPALSWAENEVLGALRRLARAQAQLVAAEAQVAAVGSASFDPADVERLEQVHAELASARAKATGRFAKGAARQRVRELETTERLVLDRLGVASYDEYRARADRSQGSQVVDSEVIDFARRELASAQRAYHEVQALEVVAPEVPEAASPAPPEPEIDLT